MATTNDNLLFLDTNILVYAAVAESPYHGACVHFLKEQRHSGVKLVVSRQVLREFMATLSRSQSAFPAVQREKIVRIVAAFQRRMAICDDHALVSTHLLRLFAEIPVGGKQVHDANIVATMLAHGIPTLATYNVSDFRRFEPLIHLTTPETSL